MVTEGADGPADPFTLQVWLRDRDRVVAGAAEVAVVGLTADEAEVVPREFRGVGEPAVGITEGEARGGRGEGGRRREDCVGETWVAECCSMWSCHIYHIYTGY